MDLYRDPAGTWHRTASCQAARTPHRANGSHCICTITVDTDDTLHHTLTELDDITTPTIEQRGWLVKLTSSINATYGPDHPHTTHAADICANWERALGAPNATWATTIITELLNSHGQLPSPFWFMTRAAAERCARWHANKIGARCHIGHWAQLHRPGARPVTLARDLTDRGVPAAAAVTFAHLIHTTYQTLIDKAVAYATGPDAPTRLLHASSLDRTPRNTDQALGAASIACRDDGLLLRVPWPAASLLTHDATNLIDDLGDLDQLPARTNWTEVADLARILGPAGGSPEDRATLAAAALAPTERP